MLKEILKLDRTLIILLLGVLLSHLGTYMVMPMLPIILKIDNGLSLVQIGSILASIAIAFQLGSIFGGVLADRVGRRFIIGLGALITAMGIFGFGFFNGFFPLLLMAMTMGFGTGLNAPSTKAAIAALASVENRTTAFSLRGIFANVGTGSAGLIIFFLITESSNFIFWIGGVIYIWLAFQSWLFLPKECGDLPCPPVPRSAYREVFKNKPFIVFSIVTIFIWALYAQLSLTLPLIATEILAEPKNVALIWTVNSAIVILSQSVITMKIINRVHPLTALSFGILFISAGISALFFATSFLFLIMSGAIFVIGEMLILPTIDSTISQLSKAELIGLFFALSNVVSGLGDAGGKSIGGNLLQVGSGENSIIWMVYLITGITLFLVVNLLKKWQPLANSLRKAALKENKPKHAPRVLIEPSEHRTQPYNNWKPEFFFRKRENLE
ncbi:MFS transporter [Litchfieldia salsa]|uniref:Major Facilitator Superfamily protein n=1 Tax=Litchfieldia salsa TaxID=930152 RepID=A0A1H0QAY2_9BACI|nr:MFS transporter [Litchfieldia salsa]SDP14531.1 Major Facilitator Superfamily protein [Litchfieldia salsa]